MSEPILSRDNARVKHACRLRESPAARREEGLFFAEGLRLCQDLAQGLDPVEAFCTPALLAAHPECAGLAGGCTVVSEQVAEKLSGTRTPQGVFCLFPCRTTRLSGPGTCAGPRQCGCAFAQCGGVRLSWRGAVRAVRRPVFAKSGARFYGGAGAARYFLRG